MDKEIEKIKKELYIEYLRKEEIKRKEYQSANNRGYSKPKIIDKINARIR